MKEQKAVKVTVPKLTCVVLIPTDKSFEDVWLLALRPAILKAGLEPVRVDNSLAAVDVVAALKHSIFEANLVIADVTNGNPNVMYEFGLTHAIGRRYILVAEKRCKIPFNISGLRYLAYDRNALADFQEMLEESIAIAMLPEATPVEQMAFPMLKLVTREIEKDMEYLRRRSKKLLITAFPPTADRIINNSSEMLESYGYLPFSIVSYDDDFSNIRNQPEYGKEFLLLESVMRQSWESNGFQRDLALKEVSEISKLTNPTAEKVIHSPGQAGKTKANKKQ